MFRVRNYLIHKQKRLFAILCRRFEFANFGNHKNIFSSFDEIVPQIEIFFSHPGPDIFNSKIQFYLFLIRNQDSNLDTLSGHHATARTRSFRNCFCTGDDQFFRFIGFGKFYCIYSLPLICHKILIKLYSMPSFIETSNIKLIS